MSMSRKEALDALDRGDATALGQPADAVAKARALRGQDALDALATLPAPLVEWVLAYAADHGQTALLARAALGPKVVAKAAKKELYRLRSTGTAVAVPAVKAESAKPAPTLESLPCVWSNVTGDGDIGFCAARLDAAGQADAFMGIVNDRRGLTRCQRNVMTRRDYRQFIREMRHNNVDRMIWDDVTPRRLGDTFKRLLPLTATTASIEAASLALQAHFGGDAARDVSSSSAWPPAEPAVEGERLAAAPTLVLQEPEFWSWLPEERAFEALGTRLDEIGQSPLFVDEKQRREAGEAEFGKVVDAYMAGPEAERLAKRLEHNADLLAARSREAHAQQAAAVARSLRSSDRSGARPFVQALFDHALALQMEAMLQNLSEEERTRIRGQAMEAAAEQAKSPLILP
jgi:hypothetical protein